MKSLLAIVAALFAVSAFAADAPAKKEEAKSDRKSTRLNSSHRL